ncbi:MAG: class I adenylate-forming enzyme family protein [Roseovarius sp.]
MHAEYHQPPAVPCPAPFNMAAHVLGRAHAHPEKLALAILGLSDAEHWRYSQLERAVRGTGTGLLQNGLKPGDKVLMRLGNTVDFPIAYLGAIAVGLVPVPTSSQLTEPEVARMIDTLDPAAILRGPGIACPDAPGRLVLSLEDLHAMRDLPGADWHMGDPNRPAYIIYTSGTSGTPRAVVHAHRAIWARQMMMQGWYGLTGEDRLCHAGAFNWTYTLGTGLMDPWTVGATSLIPGDGVTTDQVPSLLAKHRATIFAAAPGVYRKMLTADLPSLPDLRHGLSAGEKLSEPLRDHWTTATGTPIYEAYGMSECSTFVSGCPDHPVPFTTLGRPQPGRRVAIVGPDGPVALGEEGTIAIHRDDPGLMLEYLGTPDETSAKYQGEWFLTGDQGEMDAEGHITYLGRADDMMNAGGYRVSPMEVEAVMNAYPGLTQCAVTDIEVKADARLIMAFYTSDAPLDEAALAKHASAALARYKCPRGFFHLPSLPVGANGKLLRRALRPIYEDLHGSA